MSDVEKAVAAITTVLWCGPLGVLGCRALAVPAATTRGRLIALVMLGALVILPVTTFLYRKERDGPWRPIHHMLFGTVLLSGLTLILASAGWTVFTLAFAEPLEEPGLVVVIGGAALIVSFVYVASALLIDQSFLRGRLVKFAYAVALVAGLPAGLVLRSALWGVFTGFI